MILTSIKLRQKSYTRSSLIALNPTDPNFPFNPPAAAEQMNAATNILPPISRVDRLALRP